MADKVRVGDMSEEQSRLLRLLSPEERLDILVSAAAGKRKAFSSLPEQVDFNGQTYIVYPMERLDLAVRAMTEGKPVLVKRECAICHSVMYDSPVRRNQWEDACKICRGEEVGLMQKEELCTQLMPVLEAFLKSSDFKEGIVSSTRASWGGSGYSVELLPDGTSRVLWNNEIGNLYETPGVILSLPALDYDPEDKDEYVDGGTGTESEFLAEQFYLEESENAQILRDKLSDKFACA